MRSLLLLVALALAFEAPGVARAKCVMTQTCVNPDNEPDYDACIPEALQTPADPQPVRF
jgi:hypothetical protein